MAKNIVSSFEIVRHHTYSWSYKYVIDGKKRDISGSSLSDLKSKVLRRDLPWDYENYPDEKITNSQYDDRQRKNIKKYSLIVSDDTGDAPLEDPRLPRYAKSRRKY